jgi:ABC-type multidrug transport system fused ATPase/permease subunit
MPALQVVFTGVSEVKYTKSALDNLLRDLEDEKYQMADLKGRKDHTDSSGIPSDSVKDIVADGIWYTYPNQNEPVLRGINFSIKAKSTVGIIGSTGSGKTTLVDILLGLFSPSKGCFRINGGQLAGDNLRTWKSRVGYVPQEIFLLDDTVTNNVAYAIKTEEIDNAAVERACKLAEIHETIENDLDLGYKTIVGERGVKLSGGQRQRLGIARALYHDPEVLVFDEGTSALDNVTEKKLMDQVRRLSGKKTIIMIAHRLTTLQSCDIIYCLENGIIVDQGTYIEVSGRNKLFLEVERKHK